MLRVVVQDEEGNEISEGVDLSSSILPPLTDTRFVCLRFVDEYGDTVFNQLQIPIVLEELAVLKVSTEDRASVEEIEVLARICQQEPHLYLKFIGD
jgi:hypothetical protein